VSDRPQLIATDLDRTLLDADGRVSARTRRALSAVEAAGIGVVFVTARPPRWIAPFLPDVDKRGLVVCANGALALDIATDEVVLSRLLSADVVLELAGRLRSVLPELHFGVESMTGLAVEPSFVPAEPFPEQPRVGDLADILDPAPLKLLARDAAHTSDELLAIATPVCEGLGQPSHSGADGLLEISSDGTSKASALAWVAEQRGIEAADVWAFGDSPNDLPMLAWAGRSYAVANAHPSVLAQATHRCGAHTEDGVAQVLETLTR
jgi:hypothetical protein